MVVKPKNVVTVSPVQFEKLQKLADKFDNEQMDDWEFAEACQKVCPELKTYHDNQLIVDWKL